MSTLNEYTCQLSTEEKAYLAANLNETDEIRPIKIAEMRQWIIENNLHMPTGIYISFQTYNINLFYSLYFFCVKKHVFCTFIDDFFVLRFLRACKFNTEKTKSKLQNYFKQRTYLPEWYSDRNPFLPEIQELFDLG